MHRFIFPFSLVLMCATMVRADNPEDISAIKETAGNYMESWYQGDAKRMRASVHGKLAKRSLDGPFGGAGLRHTTASGMIRHTENGYGINLWQEGHTLDVIVLDHYKNIASVKVITPHYHEYLHLAKIDNQWVILNALYEKKTSTRESPVKKGKE